MQKIDLAELRRLHEAATKGMNWQEEVAFSEACKVYLPALLDELEAARAELEALKVPLAIYERHTKAIGAAEELERLADSANELREMYLTEEFYGLRAFSPMLLSNSMKQRAAKLRQEAENGRND